MRKNLFIAVFLIGILVLSGCAGDSYTSNNDTPIPANELEQLYANNFENNPSYIPASPIGYAPANVKLPNKVDWSNFATPVKSQGIYPTCTSFATIAAIEIQENIDNNTPGKDRDYSEADLHYRVWNKSPDYYRKGSVVKWVLQSTTQFNGYCREIDAPYSILPNPVTYRVKIPVCRKIKTFQEFNGADNMKYNLTKGPIVSTMIYYRDFNSYTGGEYKAKSSAYSGCHALCVVGFDDNQKCWIVKNSWGSRWGQGGYAKIAYGVGKIEMYASYAVTTK